MIKSRGSHPLWYKICRVNLQLSDVTTCYFSFFTIFTTQNLWVPVTTAAKRGNRKRKHTEYVVKCTKISIITAFAKQVLFVRFEVFTEVTMKNAVFWDDALHPRSTTYLEYNNCISATLNHLSSLCREVRATKENAEIYIQFWRSINLWCRRQTINHRCTLKYGLLFNLQTWHLLAVPHCRNTESSVQLRNFLIKTLEDDPRMYGKFRVSRYLMSGAALREWNSHPRHSADYKSVFGGVATAGNKRT
jgi:hypothetical protein